MTGPDKFVSDWERELQLSMEYKEKFSSSKDWLTYFDYYRGKYASDLVYVNKIFAYVRSLQPRIYFRKPMVTITPKRPDMAQAAKVLEAVDNYLINEVMLKNPLKDTSLFSILCGTGVLKLGFDSEFGYASTQVLGADGETLTQVSKDGNKIEYNTNIKPGMPWADSVSPLDIFTPWGIRDVASLPWVAHAILRPIEDIKADSKYRNTKDLRGGFERHGITSSYREMIRRTGQNVSNELNLGLLWEIRDWKRREIVVISEGKVLLREPDELQIEGLPYEFLIFNRDPEHFWGIADVEQVVRQQLEYNSVRTTINKHVRLSVLKFLVGRGLMKKRSWTSSSVKMLVRQLKSIPTRLDRRLSNLLHTFHLIYTTTFVRSTKTSATRSALTRIQAVHSLPVLLQLLSKLAQLTWVQLYVQTSAVT